MTCIAWPRMVWESLRFRDLSVVRKLIFMQWQHTPSLLLLCHNCNCKCRTIIQHIINISTGTCYNSQAILKTVSWCGDWVEAGLAEHDVGSLHPSLSLNQTGIRARASAEPVPSAPPKQAAGRGQHAESCNWVGVIKSSTGGVYISRQANVSTLFNFWLRRPSVTDQVRCRHVL